MQWSDGLARRRRMDAAWAGVAEAGLNRSRLVAVQPNGSASAQARAVRRGPAFIARVRTSTRLGSRLAEP